MKRLLMLALLAGGAWLLRRSSLGLRLGNEIRALSDRLMLGALRATSEFEREST